MPDSWKDMTVAAVEARNARICGAKLITAPSHIHHQALPEKRAKFGNKKTLCGGIMFDSGHEADRYLTLKAMEELGEIRDLELQPKFGIFGCELSSGRGIEVASFKADFRYFDVAENRTRIEDAKSDGTKGETAYRLRKKLVEACHSIIVEEV